LQARVSTCNASLMQAYRVGAPFMATLERESSADCYRFIRFLIKVTATVRN
jgi:hypothetical protein